MTVTQEAILNRFGLSKNQAKAYAYLKKYGDSTASQIANATKIPRSKSYDALNTLIKKGLLLKIPSKPVKFRANNLNVIKSIITHENKLLNQLTENVNEKFQVYLTLGQRQVMRQFTMETNKATKSTYSIVRKLKGQTLNLAAAKRALKRGVKIRILALDTPAVRKIAALWTKTGIEIRLYEKTEPEGLRLTIFDNELTRFTIGKPEVENSEDYTTVWIKSKAIAAMCAEYFEWKWKNAKKTTGK